MDIFSGLSLNQPIEMEKIKLACQQFCIAGTINKIKRFGEGLINSSFRVTLKDSPDENVLQKIYHLSSGMWRCSRTTYTGSPAISAGNAGRDDYTDLTKVSFNLEIFRAHTRGNLEEAKDFLTPVELEILLFGARARLLSCTNDTLPDRLPEWGHLL